MKNVIRAATILLLFIYLIPSHFIETHNLKMIIMVVYGSICAVLFTLSIASHTNRISRHAAIEKTIATACMIITIIIAIRCLTTETFYSSGYKFITIIILIYSGNELSKQTNAYKIVNDITSIIYIYVIGLAFAVIFLGQETLLQRKGAGGLFTRLDFTGSVTLMAVVSTLVILLAINRIHKENRRLQCVWHATSLISALYLLFLGASRQSLLILLISTGLVFLSGKWSSRRDVIIKLRCLGLFALFVMSFIIFTIFVNDSLYIRIFDNQLDFTSGRLNSITMWIDEMNQHGGPLGFGYIRLNVIEEIEFLWPHNEFIRFYIEGGLLGLVIMILLLCDIALNARVAFKTKPGNNVRYFTVSIVSVMLVQLNLDNFIHNIYGGSFYFFLLSICGNTLAAEYKVASTST